MAAKDEHEPSPESLEATRKREEPEASVAGKAEVDATVLSPPHFDPEHERGDKTEQTVPFREGDAPVPSKRGVEETQLASPESAALGKPAPRIPAPPASPAQPRAQAGEPKPRDAGAEARDPAGATDPDVRRTNKLVLLGLVGGATLVFSLLSLRSCASSGGDEAPSAKPVPTGPKTIEPAKQPGRFKVGERVRVVVGDGLQGGTVVEADGPSYKVRLDSGAEERLAEDRIAGRALSTDPSGKKPPPPRPSVSAKPAGSGAPG